jgi:hypothetical protein
MTYLTMNKLGSKKTKMATILHEHPLISHAYVTKDLSSVGRYYPLRTKKEELN